MYAAGLIDRLACLVEERDSTVDNDPALVRVEAMTAFSSNLCSKERDDRLINVC